MVYSSHNLKDLSPQPLPYLSLSQLQLYHLIFIENPTVTLKSCPPLNQPPYFLPLPQPSSTHSCQELIQFYQPPRADLVDSPLPDASQTIFVDGSTFKTPGGSTQAAYAVVTTTEVIERQALPPGTTSQQAELVALTRGLLLSKDQAVNIFTDSRYAFLIAHSHCMLWKRGFSLPKEHPS